MRRTIRRWLGITDSSTSCNQDPIDIEVIRKEIARGIDEALKPEYASIYYILNPEQASGLRARMSAYIGSIVRETAQKAANDWLSKQVSPEKFIDEIVARIKAKQL